MKKKISANDKKINDLEETVNNKESEISELKAEISNLQAELESKKAKDVAPITSTTPLSSSRTNIKPQIKNIGSSKVEPTQAPKNPTDFNSPYKSEVGNLPSWKLREMEKKKEEEAKRNEEIERKKELAKNFGRVEEETHAPGFVDPLTRKAPTTENPSAGDGESAPFGGGKDVDEKAILEAEMARMNRTIKKGGTIL